MAEPSPPGLSDLLALLGSNNPVTGVTRSFSQFQRGVEQFLVSIERLNETLDQLNQTSKRVNALLDTVEEPIRAAVPQVTRTIKTADTFFEILTNPAILQFPVQLAQAVDNLGELVRRLQPLSQLSDAAGMFGIRLPSGLRAPGRPSLPAVVLVEPAPAPAPQPAVKKPAQKTTAKKTTAKKRAPANKKAAVKKAPATKPSVD